MKAARRSNGPSAMGPVLRMQLPHLGDAGRGVNRELPHTDLRYLERSIREAFEFGSTPIKLRVRKRSE